MTDKTMVITLTLPGDADTGKLFYHFPRGTLYTREDVPNKQLIDKNAMRELAGQLGVAIYRTMAEPVPKHIHLSKEVGEQRQAAVDGLKPHLTKRSMQVDDEIIEALEAVPRND